MKIDLFSQRILFQIDSFYAMAEDSIKMNLRPGASVSQFFQYDLIYDFLEKEGKLPTWPDEIKKECWSKAQKSFITYKESDKKEINKYYKSHLIVKYLLSKLPERFDLYDENGKPPKRYHLILK